MEQPIPLLTVDDKGKFHIGTKAIEVLHKITGKKNLTSFLFKKKKSVRKKNAIDLIIHLNITLLLKNDDITFSDTLF
jgi:hypothetical protein